MLMGAIMFLTFYAPQGAFHGQSTDAIAATIDALYFAGDARGSLAVTESALVRADDLELRWRAARAAIACGTLSPSQPERTMLYDRAILHARRAVALQPSSTHARYWLAASVGRRAHKDDPVRSARLAIEVHVLASGILADDSSHGGAHHALGMLHAEVSRVPALARFMASRVLRVNLAGRANVRDAERHLRRAVALDPSSVQFLADLAAFLVTARRLSDADTVMARLHAAPLRHPTDALVRAQALALRRAHSRPMATDRRGSPAVATMAP